jgi:hypothetical protein
LQDQLQLLPTLHGKRVRFRQVSKSFLPSIPFASTRQQHFRIATVPSRRGLPEELFKLTHFLPLEILSNLKTVKCIGFDATLTAAELSKNKNRKTKLIASLCGFQPYELKWNQFRRDQRFCFTSASFRCRLSPDVTQNCGQNWGRFKPYAAVCRNHFLSPLF